VDAPGARRTSPDWKKSVPGAARLQMGEGFGAGAGPIEFSAGAREKWSLSCAGATGALVEPRRGPDGARTLRVDGTG